MAWLLAYWCAEVLWMLVDNVSKKASTANPNSNAAIFLFLLTVISYYFSSKMIRLVLML